MAGMAAGEWFGAPEGPGEGLFDQIVMLAGSHCAASIAFLVLTRERRQWVWSKVGAPGMDPARLSALADRIAAQPAAFAVCDTRTDPNWASDPAIVAAPPIRACGAAPVLSPGGHVIGFLGVLCLEPGESSRAGEVIDSLTTLARLVTGQLQLRRIFYEYETLVGVLEQAQATLKASEESFRIMAEHATDMITRATPDGVYLYVSPACRAQRGYAPEEMVGRSAFEFFHPDDAPRVRRELATKIASAETATFTYRVRRKDGGYIRVESSGRLLRDPATGAPRELIVVTRDVTHRGQ